MKKFNIKEHEAVKSNSEKPELKMIYSLMRIISDNKPDKIQNKQNNKLSESARVERKNNK